MEQLIKEMKVSLATVFSFYLKAHNFHWNVTGPDFMEYHDFFGTIYETVFASVDTYAEHIRALDTFAPGSYARFSELSLIKDETNVPSTAMMVNKLQKDNDLLLAQIYKAADLAESMKERGLLNFLEGQIDYHEKLNWMLKSSK